MTVQATTSSTLAGLVPGTYAVDPAHSEVGFVVRHLMVSKVKGRFTQVTGTITVAEDHLLSTVEAEAQVASVDTREPNRDNHLRSGDFFEAETYPTIAFRSTGIRAKGSDFLLDGDLTIKGVTRPVTFELEYNGAQANPLNEGVVTVGFSAWTEVNRKDWGLEYNMALESGGVLIADKVKISLEIEAAKVA